MLGRITRDCDGAAAAEMAVVAPLLIFLMFGAMEVGYYFYSEHVVVKAVRDGARFASRRSFDNYDCASQTINAAVVTDTQEITRTDQVSGGAARLPGWTDDSSVEVTMPPCDTSGDYNASFYQGLTAGVPIVRVTATVPYTSLFSVLGFGGPNFQLKAASEVPVMGT